MKTLVLLVNFGGARSVDDVPWFLRQMTGRDAPQSVVSAVSDRYRAIGGTSPMAAIADEQAVLLAKKTGNRFSVLSAYRYSRPTLEERIDEARVAGFEHLVFFVMSPYYASRTTGNYVTAVETCLAGQPRGQGQSYRLGQPYRPVVTFVHGWYDEPAFLDCWASMIRAQRSGPVGPGALSFDVEMPGDDPFYIFSAHSLPRSACEPYQTQVEETARAVAARLGIGDNYAVAWQSITQSASEPWIGPSVETVMDGLAGKVSNVVEVPLGFVNDHLETRYDMDVVHREHARALGLGFFRTPSLNTYGPFISALAVILEKALGERA